MKLALFATAILSFACGANGRQLLVRTWDIATASDESSNADIHKKGVDHRPNEEYREGPDGVFADSERNLKGYDCWDDGRGYFRGQWRWHCGDKRGDKSQCMWDGDWGNYRKDTYHCGGEYNKCYECQKEKGYKKCVNMGRCSKDCDVCKKYKSYSWCRKKGYCDQGSGGILWNKYTGRACKFRGGSDGIEDEDFSKWYNKTFGWCQKKCEKMGGCKAFDFDSGSKDRCRIFWNYPTEFKKKVGLTCWKKEKYGY